MIEKNITQKRYIKGTCRTFMLTTDHLIFPVYEFHNSFLFVFYIRCARGLHKWVCGLSLFRFLKCAFWLFLAPTSRFYSLQNNDK